MSQEQVDKTYKVTDDAIHGFFGPHRFLSNFHVCDVEYGGEVFPSTEAAYQAAKFKDKGIRAIFTNVTPVEAKKLGRKYKLREDWEEVKDGVMLLINQRKFTNHSDLRELLLATGNKFLEETNWWYDTYWGVCNGEGRNKLGLILMEIRSHLPYF